MKIAAAALIAVSLAGCAAFDPEPYKIVHPTSTITVKVDSMLGYMHEGEVDPRWAVGGGVIGMAVLYPATSSCVITLREYPRGLQHEMRHCIENNWYPEENASFPGNTDDVFVDDGLTR